MLHSLSSLALKYLAQACPPGSQENTCLPQVRADEVTLQMALQIVFGVIGAVAVIIIVVAAFQFVLSGGESQSVAKARETIIYAVAGLVIAISAEVIVTFVIGRL